MKKNKDQDPKENHSDTAEKASNAAGQSQHTDGEMVIESDQLEILKEELAEREKDFDQLSEKHLRLAAEYDNFRRRSQKEKEGLYVESIASVVREMLPVFDNLERARLAAEAVENKGVDKIVEGIDMIQKQADEALQRLGVSRIDCVGQPFDPELHEAVMHVEDDSVGPSTVVEELQVGYRRDNRVIRHSIVKVAN